MAYGASCSGCLDQTHFSFLQTDDSCETHMCGLISNIEIENPKLEFQTTKAVSIQTLRFSCSRQGRSWDFLALGDYFHQHTHRAGGPRNPAFARISVVLVSS